jgi:hypothetical protein
VWLKKQPTLLVAAVGEAISVKQISLAKTFDFDIHSSFSLDWLFCSKVFFFRDILEDPSFVITIFPEIWISPTSLLKGCSGINFVVFCFWFVDITWLIFYTSNFLDRI